MPERPTGTITFLFTDIEGSARLWDRDEALASEAVERHDALLRRTIEGRGGLVFKTVGDAFCAAFPGAKEALLAALDAQRALSAEGAFPFRVRMGLHTGPAHERDDDYFGPTVNRVARIEALAAGGQVLVSSATEALLRGAFPGGASFLDLGLHRLRDLSRAERLYQALDPALPADFPPLRSVDAFPNNLPLQLTTFIGRERELAEVWALLASKRLVTLTGAGGSGKTRLALEAGAAALPEHADGVWLVDLAPLSDPEGLPRAVAAVLGVREEAGRPLLASLLDVLRPRSVLLLLDNCEHVVVACARLARALLEGAPALRILATSREPLGVPGEAAWRVPSLDLPMDGDPAAAAEGAPPCEAVALFLDRARSVLPSFAPLPSDLTAILKVCRRLDGIPLAIELAAARVNVLTPPQIAARLDDRFRLLTGGSRTAMARQQTLRALVDWGWDLLGEEERACLRRLSVFVGGFTIEAAEAVAPGSPVADPLDAVSRLVSKSFVVAAEPMEGGARHGLLETIRQYGRERLVESGEGPRTRDRHLAFLRAFAEGAEPEVARADAVAWLRRIDLEHENARAALDWAAGSAPAAAEGLALALALLPYWKVRGHLAEGRERLRRLREAAGEGLEPGLRRRVVAAEATLSLYQGEFEEAERGYLEVLRSAPAGSDPRLEADATHGLGSAALRLGDRARALSLYEEALAARRALGDPRSVGISHMSIGLACAEGGDVAKARLCLEEALRIFRSEGNSLSQATAIGHLGYLAVAEGDIDRARGLFAQTVGLCRGNGDRMLLATALNSLGATLSRLSRLPEARAALEEALALREGMGLRQGTCDTLANLASVRAESGDPAAAHALLARGLDLSRAAGDQGRVARALYNFAEIAMDGGDARRAARLLGAAEGAAGSLPLWRSEVERLDHEALTGRIRGALGADAWGREIARGRVLDVDQAVADARGGAPVPRAAGP